MSEYYFDDMSLYKDGIFQGYIEKAKKENKFEKYFFYICHDHCISSNKISMHYCANTLQEIKESVIEDFKINHY